MATDSTSLPGWHLADCDPANGTGISRRTYQPAGAAVVYVSPWFPWLPAPAPRRRRQGGGMSRPPPDAAEIRLTVLEW